MPRKQAPSPFPTTKKIRVPPAPVPAPAGPKRSTVSSKVGAQIKSLRNASGVSAGTLATQAEISRSMFSRIENGLVSPSIEVLDRIAAALDVPMSRFFVDQTRRLDLSFVPAGKGLRIERVDAVAGYVYQLLGHVLSGNLFVEPYLVSLTPEAKPYAAFQHPGLKFIFMLSGRMKYRYGSHTLELKPGDALLYDARALHGAEVLRERPISYLSVVFTLRE